MTRGVSELAGATVSGYLHPAYAQSLAECGTPLELPRCRGWVLRRRIPGSALEDAMWCYPLFSCDDWSQLGLDLDELDTEMVSLSVVTDPFGDYDAGYLKECLVCAFLASP